MRLKLYLATNTTDWGLLSSYYSIQVEESIDLEEVLGSDLFSEIHIFVCTFIAVIHHRDILKCGKISRVFIVYI